MTLRLHVLGSSGSWAAPGAPASGFVVEDATTRIVMDLGFGTMAEIDDVASIDAVVLTHRHPDHCADVLALFHLWGYGPARRTGVPLIGPVSALDALSRFVGAHDGHPFHRVFDCDPVAGGDSRRVRSMSVSFTEMDHSAPTNGIRVEAGGRSLFYTGDTGLAGEWWRHVGPVDLLLGEASWQGDGSDQDFSQHLTAAEAGWVATEMRVDHLVLTHLKPTLDAVRSIAEARQTFSGRVSHADPGTTIEV